MGRVSESFDSVTFHNEAEVSQRFLVPLLCNFLGYASSEILPESVVPAFDIPQNRQRSLSTSSLSAKARPDYVVAVDGAHKLVCDSKGPGESLDDHLDQLIAYCIALGVNLLLITNGSEVRVYDANDPVFKSMSIADLDLSFGELEKLLHRSNVAKYSNIERIQMLDIGRSLNLESDHIRIERQRKIAITLSDFQPYLRAVSQWQLADELPASIRDAFTHDFQAFPPQKLHTFRECQGTMPDGRKADAILYDAILRGDIVAPLLLIGESGIGKTSLFQRLARDQAQRCLDYESDSLPVLVKLGQYTPSRSLQQLIHDALNGKGMDVSSEQFRTLLKEGRFILLLDAFDEVSDVEAPNLAREIESLLDNYRSNRILITTRHFRVPAIASVRRYEVEPLPAETVEAFARMYLDTDSRSFLAEMSRKGLTKLASNTLLLTFMILLYRRNGQLPNSRGQILGAVVHHVCEHNRLKQERFSRSLPWQIQERLLEDLSFLALSEGSSYSLGGDLVDQTFETALTDLKKRHVISSSFTLEEARDSLAATGFLHAANDALIFWHSAFMEYFGAARVAQRCMDAPKLLAEWTAKPGWENVLSLATLRAGHPDLLIEALLTHNGFIAARGLIECGICAGDAYRSVADFLHRRLASHYYPIRRLALDLLRQLSGDYVDGLFCALLDSCDIGVQKTALVEIARRRLPGARETVLSRLDWNVPTSLTNFWDGPSGTAVIEALGELGDPEAHLHIISLWQSRVDMFTSMSCQRVLSRAACRGTFDARVIEALVDLFLRDDPKSYHDVSGIADVLIAAGNPAVAPRLITALRKANHRDTQYRDWNISRILASFVDPQVICQLIDIAKDKKIEGYARSRFAEALSESRGFVPLEVYVALAQDDDLGVKRYAISALVRFSFNDVKAIVLPALYPPPLEESRWSSHRYAYVQGAAVEVLVQHGQTDLLLEEYKPEYFYSNSLETLFADIVSKQLNVMIPLVRAISERSQDNRISINAAWVLADLGHVGEAQEILEGLRNKCLTQLWVPHDILEGIHRLPADYALAVVDEILRRRSEIPEDSRLVDMKCCDALTQIGTSGAIDRLANIALSEINDSIDLLAENALRGIEFLAPKEREGWLVELIRSHPEMSETVLHRALDTLGVLGSEESLLLLSEYTGASKSEQVHAVAFWAMHNIHRRAGLVWYDGEEKS